MNLELSQKTVWNLIVNMKNTLLYYTDSIEKNQNSETISQLKKERIEAAWELYNACVKIAYADVELTYLLYAIRGLENK